MRLTDLVQHVQGELRLVQRHLTELNSLVTNRLDVAVSSRASQVSLNVLSAHVDSRLDVAVSTRASQSSVDALTATVDEQGALALRMEIEADLSEPSHQVALSSSRPRRTVTWS